MFLCDYVVKSTQFEWRKVHAKAQRRQKRKEYIYKFIPKTSYNIPFVLGR